MTNTYDHEAAMLWQDYQNDRADWTPDTGGEAGPVFDDECGDCGQPLDSVHCSSFGGVVSGDWAGSL